MQRYIFAADRMLPDNDVGQWCLYQDVCNRLDELRSLILSAQHLVADGHLEPQEAMAQLLDAFDLTDQSRTPRQSMIYPHLPAREEGACGSRND